MPRPILTFTKKRKTSTTTRQRVAFGATFETPKPANDLEIAAKKEYEGEKLITAGLVGLHGTAEIGIPHEERTEAIKERLKRYSQERNELAFKRLEKANKVAWVVRHITARGREIGGLGKEALKEAERLARKEGVNFIYATTEVSNKLAWGSYEGVGWICLGKQGETVLYGKFL